MVRKASKQAYNIVRRFEGLRLEAYKCPAGKWTIGYGHTKNVKEGDKITKEYAETLLICDVKDCEHEINDYKLRLNQNQYDALVSFVFNIGGKQFSTSTLLKKLKVNVNDTSIAYEFSRWIYSAGKVESGLIKRRNEESNLYFNPVN